MAAEKEVGLGEEDGDASSSDLRADELQHAEARAEARADEWAAVGTSADLEAEAALPASERTRQRKLQMIADENAREVHRP
eukprot:SAG11_NODE_5790_length_1462_cov_8.147361_2_plen_81_part_00